MITDIVVKNPEIDELDKDGVKYKMYKRLYKEFFNVQIPYSESFPNGIQEGDQLSIRLHNTAFNFADVVGDSIEIGASGGEIDLTNLLKKDGDKMTGKLQANQGFEAGENGRPLIKTFVDKNGELGIEITNQLRVGGKSLIISGKNVLSRDSTTDTTTISDNHVIIDSQTAVLPQDTKIGDVEFTEDGIRDGDKIYYHSENSNLDTVDWTGKTIVAHEGMISKKDIIAHGTITSMGGISIYDDDASVLSAGKDKVYVGADLYISKGLYAGKYQAIKPTDDGIVIKAGKGGRLTIGSSETGEVRIAKPIKTWDGSKPIISEYGAGTFTSLTASHDGSTPVLKTYRDGDDKGVIIDQKIRFLSSKGVSLHSIDESFIVEIPGGQIKTHRGRSISVYQPQNRDSFSMFIDTDDDFIAYTKPLEADAVSITGKQTRLSDRLLELGRGHLIESSGSRMVTHGDMAYTDNLSSPKFSSGYAGYGWALINNKITGMTALTVDEMTVRRKMRIYELEVQKISATNGSIWVSDSIKADIVEQII